MGDELANQKACQSGSSCDTQRSWGFIEHELRNITCLESTNRARRNAFAGASKSPVLDFSEAKTISMKAFKVVRNAASCSLSHLLRGGTASKRRIEVG